RAKSGSVIGADQPLQRDRDEIGVAQKPLAVMIGTSHRFHDKMLASGLVDHLEIIAGRDIQHLDQPDAAGRRWWRCGNADSAVKALNRLPLDNTVLGQISQRPNAAGISYTFD